MILCVWERQRERERGQTYQNVNLKHEDRYGGVNVDEKGLLKLS